MVIVMDTTDSKHQVLRLLPVPLIWADGGADASFTRVRPIKLGFSPESRGSRRSEKSL